MPRRSPRGDAAEEVATRAQTARALAEIGDQGLLDDPRTNPATRGEYDRLRDAQQRRALELEHARMLRRGRVADRRAAEAETALEAIAAARESISPARAVTMLQRGRARFLAGALAASIALSVGSAMGLAAVSVHTGGPALAGWIAELCLTVATTAAILYRSHVDQASTVVDEAADPWAGWRGPLLWALVGAPLATSVGANLAGWYAGAAVSPVNALCAVGAGIAGVFAFLVADVSARAIRANAAAVDDADEDELRRVAMGGVFEDHQDQSESWDAPPPPLTSQERAATRSVMDIALDDPALTERMLASIAGQLGPLPEDGEDGDSGEPAPPAPPRGSGPHSTARTPDDGGESTERVLDAPAQTDADQGQPATARASEAARERGAHTRERVRAILARDPHARTGAIARELGVHPSTVRRARAELDGGGR